MVLASRDLLTVMDGDKKLSSLASLEAQRAGLERTFGRLQALDIDVVLLGDVLFPGFDVPDCLSAHPHDPMACSYSATSGAPKMAADRAAAAAAGVPVLEVTSAMCPDGTCPPIAGAVIVYRDAHHVTATYARTLMPLLKRQLEQTPAWGRLTSS